MSEFDEPRIRCPSCGKMAPAMKYCIYCGAKLPQPAPPTVAPPTPTPSAPLAVQPPALPAVGVRDEFANLMSGVTALHERKAALLELFQSGQVSERVFLKLYNEYATRLSISLSTRADKMKEITSKLDGQNKRLSEVGMELEELDVRKKLGEIDAKEYSQKVDSLKKEERELGDSIKMLKENIETLKNILAEKKPSEIRDLEMNVRTYQSLLERLVEEGKISAETYEAINPDIEETLDFFDSLTKERKDREKTLREQLETLQTRYKLSELSIEEYEKKKRELQAEIDKIWT